MKIEVENIVTAGGTQCLIAMTNASGAMARLSSRGAGVAAVLVPDVDGRLGGVVANYIPCNDDGNWRYEIVADDEVLFVSESRERVGHADRISYRWTEDNVLEIYFHAGTCLAEIENILGRTYFNLDGNPEAFMKEYLWINSSDSPDFSRSTQLRERLVTGEEVVHNWRLRDWQEDVMNDAALLASHRSGRQLSVHTSFPKLCITIPSSGIGVSFSTINPLADSLLSTQQATFLHFSLLR